MKLNELQNDRMGSTSRKRVGRGIGSGKGKTAGRGHKGQKSRAGATVNGFEGGQTPIYRRLPKRGFTNIFRVEYAAVNLGQLQAFVDAKKLNASKPITEALLCEAGLIRRQNKPVKILAKGEIKTALKLEVSAASKTAIAAIEKAGGSVKVSESGKEGKSAGKAA